MRNQISSSKRLMKGGLLENVKIMNENVTELDFVKVGEKIKRSDSLIKWDSHR